MTFADLARPASRQSALLYNLALILAFSFFIAATAQVAIPVAFSPVPITGQTFGVLLTGLLLGSRRGAGAVAAMLIEGVLGLPVFAGGRAGLAVLLGPTGGYLVGFLAAAFVVGWLAERDWDRSYGLTFLAMLVGNIIIYSFGVVWLARFVGGAAPAIELGLAPFLLGDLLKILLAVILLPSGWRLVGRRSPAQ